VTQIQRAADILPREDEEVAEIVRKRFTEEGVDVRVKSNTKEVVVENGKKFMVIENGGQTERIEFDQILLAVGRAANTKGFGLEDIGVKLAKNGTVEVDDYLRTTTYNNMYACGDVAGPYQFTHTAAHQAWYCAVNSLFSPLKKFKVDYRVIPWCTFTDPEVARVGLNEKEAKEKSIPYEVTRYNIDDLDRAIADSEDHGMLKVLTVPGKDIILGVTMVGHHAGDLIAEYVAAMKHGFGLNKILGTIHIYPTLAESNKFAAGEWKKAHAPQGLLNFAKKFHAWRR
jgi:pyruvate/2-oxoglutarate dehydrogenase complex dihydrolipoamide dehydrogenase (E3) component